MGQGRGTPTFQYVVPLEDKQYTLETELTSLQITPAYEGGTVQFHLNMGFKSTHLYPSDNGPITPQIEEAIRVGLGQQLMDDISRAVALTQSYECDFLSFSEAFRIRYPNIFAQMDWENEFKKAVFSISVNVEIGETAAVEYNPTGEGE